MPRSSRHKSSKHSTRDAREYSDTEKESGLKEKKGKEDGGSGSSSRRHLKDVNSGEKLKLDSKLSDLGNAEFNDEFGGGVSSSTKKRKEKVVDDRWVGGGDDNHEHEMLKSEIKEKEKKRVSGFDVEEGKKSGSKAESKHHRSERKERAKKEKGSERERKGSRSDRSERLVDIVSVSENTGSEENRKQSGSGRERGGKHGVGNTDGNIQEEFRNPEPGTILDRRAGRKMDSSGDGDRNHGSVLDPDDKGLSSREEIAKSGKYKDDGHKDEKNRDRFPEDIDKEIWPQDEKKKDSRSTRDYTGGKSDDKHLRNDKVSDVSHKISKPHGGEYDRELDRDRELYRDHDHHRLRGRDKDRERSRLELDRDMERDDREHDRNHDHLRNDKVLDVSHKISKPHGGEYDRELDRDREQYRDHDHDRERGRDRDRESRRVELDRDRERNDREHDRNHDHLRNDKVLDVSHKISKLHVGEYDRELDRDRERYRDHDHDRERGRDRDRERFRVELDRDRERDDREHDRNHVQDLERVRDRELDRDRGHGRDRYRRELKDRVGVRDYERGRERDSDHDHDYALLVDEKGSRYKDDRGRRRSPDNYDDYHGDKLRRVETEVDKERSLSHKPNVDSVTSSGQHKASPSFKAYVGTDKYRDGIQDETKYGDSSRDGIMPEAVEKAPKYRSGEKRAKFDDDRIGEFSERSPSAKVLPAGVKERSPSSMSFDRSRFSRRNTSRRSLEADDAERRCSDSIDIRDLGTTEDRQGRDLPSKNSLGDEYPPAESPFYHKPGQGNVSSHSPGPSVFRTRSDSPSFAGSFGEHNRGHGSRYRRSVDPNVGRGPGNAWNGVPNWPSPHPNGFMPFQPVPPGPHHGGFPPIISQYPPFFGVRPTFDMNHQGIPYHLADGDRLTGPMRPIGWPNMVDGSLPHFHGWDAGNSIHRNDSAMYGPGQPAQRRDMDMDNWKQNGDVNMEVISGSQKDVPTMKAFTDEASSAHGASKPNVESSCLDDQATSFKDASSDPSPMKEIPLAPAKGTTDKIPESSGVDDTVQSMRAYLVKLDISMDLVDPGLYNQCSLVIKGECEYVGDEVDLDFMEEKADAESEITNSTLDIKIFPAAKESIFQRAMNLYKTQRSEMKSFGVADCTIMQQTLAPKERVDSPANCTIKQEEPTLVLPDEIVPKREEENSDLTVNVGDETQTLVLDVEMEEETSLELITGNADEANLCVESTYPGSVLSITDKVIVGDGDKNVIGDSIPGEQLDDTVSGALIIMCNDPVKVCEISVSNESESVVLSRIHHAPESTH